MAQQITIYLPIFLAQAGMVRAACIQKIMYEYLFA